MHTVRRGWRHRTDGAHGGDRSERSPDAGHPQLDRALHALQRDRHHPLGELVRDVYICLGCAAFYLPPESMTYPTVGIDASPVHCSAPRCRNAVEPMLAGMGVPAETVAGWARRAAGLDGEVRQPRPGRMARGRRPASGPRAARSRLL